MAMGVCKCVLSLKDIKVLTADLLLPVVLGGSAPFTCEIQRSINDYASNFSSFLPGICL